MSSILVLVIDHETTSPVTHSRNSKCVDPAFSTLETLLLSFSAFAALNVLRHQYWQPVFKVLPNVL